MSLTGAPFPDTQAVFSRGPGAVQAARSAPEGLGLDGSGALRDRCIQGKGAFLLSFPAARVAEDHGRLWRP